MSENKALKDAKAIMEKIEKVKSPTPKPLPKCDRCGSQLRNLKKKKIFCICGEEQ